MQQPSFFEELLSKMTEEERVSLTNICLQNLPPLRIYNIIEEILDDGTIDKDELLARLEA